MSIFQNNLLAAAAAAASGGGGAEGTLWAWGRGWNGVLGQGNTTNYSSPVQIGSAENWANISIGALGTAAAINSDGELWTWGDNGHGKLGLGSTTDYSTPQQVGSLTDWSTEGGHMQSNGTYKSMGCIKTDGTLWTWGKNYFGTLGLGDTSDRCSPVQVGSDTDWAYTAATEDAMFAIRTDGTMWSWGRNDDGKLGLGDSTARCSPTQIGSLTTWSNVGPMETGAGAVKTDGTIWTWGKNDNAQLGDGSQTNRSSPVQVGDLSDWKGPLGGSKYSQHVVKSDGTMWCWGYNESQAQMGLDRTQYGFITSPIQVGALTIWNEEDGNPTRSVTGGVTSKCALKTDGTLWCWGKNGYGQVGNGNTSVTSSPTQVGSDDTWIKVCQGFSETSVLAIKSS